MASIASPRARQARPAIRQDRRRPVSSAARHSSGSGTIPAVAGRVVGPVAGVARAGWVVARKDSLRRIPLLTGNRGRYPNGTAVRDGGFLRTTQPFARPVFDILALR